MKTPYIFNKELLYECNQCARCTGSCPAATVVDGFNPRNYLLTCARLGVESVITDEKLWCCTTCHVCEDRCPQMIDVTELLTALMNQAAKKGHIPEKVRAGTEMIINTGKVVQISKRTEQLRKKLGLSSLPEVAMEEVEGILLKTGLIGMME